jgi:hypothetical protein
MPISPDAINAANAVTIQVHSNRGQTAWVAYSFSKKNNPRQDNLESAVTRLVRSIFGIYWTFINAPLKPLPSDPIHVEPKVGGGYVFLDEGPIRIRVEADQEHLPVRFELETSLTKTILTPHYEPSPNPVSGDLRRIIAVDQLQITGTNRTAARLDLDYQDVDGFHIPHHASFSVGGVFTAPLEFAGCSVTTLGR